uniref:MHC class I-like antigen recognition-like domain-containing protein n=1 Tax=Kryptolebias marmoratus TaxID=37003 RepID=A0A3Q2ZE46_KRYMA
MRNRFSLRKSLYFVSALTGLPNPAYKAKNTEPTVKHSGGSIMLWYWCIEQSGWNNEGGGTLKLGHSWVFQHTSELLSDWMKQETIQLLDQPSQSKDIKLIENLWAESQVCVREPTI